MNVTSHSTLGGSSSPLSANRTDSSRGELDVTNVGGAEKYVASPDGAADPPMLRI